MLVRSVSKALQGFAVLPGSRALSTSVGTLQQQAGQTTDFAHPTEQPTTQGTSFSGHSEGLQTIDDFESAQVNYVSLIGNVVTQPVLKLDRLGRNYSNLLIAQNNKRRDRDNKVTELPASFYSVFVSGALAQQVLNQVRKGQRILVEARLASEEPLQRDPTGIDGERRERKLRLYARNVTLVASRPRGSFGGDRQGP